MNLIFNGTIRNGKLFLDKSEQFKQYLHTFPNEKRVEVTVEKVKHTRTNQQNRYYWGVVVAEIAKHTGHDAEQVHEMLKQMFSTKWYMDVGDNKYNPYAGRTVWYPSSFPTSITRLDTTAFVEYTEKCRMWANEFFALQIPLPGEVIV